MYDVEKVAKYIIKRCNDHHQIISNLKLQKILYFVQAEFLVVKNEACFHEDIEAWDFGPVVPEIYYKYRMFGSAHIPYIDNETTFPFDHNDKIILNNIIDECSKYSASALVEITHNQSPWREAYYSNCHNSIITTESIKAYFK